MDYQNIIKKSFSLVWKHRFMWLLGLLAGGSSMGPANLFSYSGSSEDWEKFKDLEQKIPSGVDNLVKAASSFDNQDLEPIINSFFQSELFWAVLIGATLLAFMGIYLSITAKSGLIYSSARLEKREDTNLGRAWKIGHKFFWRRLSLSLLYLAFFIVIFWAALVPVVITAIAGIVPLAVTLGVVIGILFLAAAIIALSAGPYAERILVLENKGPLAAISEAIALLRKNWKKILLLYLIIFAVNLVISMLSIAGVLLCGGVLVALGFLLSLISNILMLIYAIIGTIAFVIFLFAFAGLIRSFSSTIITLAYLELKSGK